MRDIIDTFRGVVFLLLVLLAFVYAVNLYSKSQDNSINHQYNLYYVTN